MKHLTEYQSFTQLLTQTMDKIMTLSSLFIPLAMILFMATACQPKIEKYTLTKEVPSANAHDSGHADGTEAYGGDVTPSVALKIYDTLTYTSDQLAEETKLKGSGSRVEGIPLPKTPTFKDDMKSIWLGIAQYLKGGRLKNINGKNYATVALKLLDNGTGKDIFYDIEHSPYDVKFGEKYDWIDPKRMSQYNFGKCKDYLGDYRAAGAKLNDIGGPICINVTELAKQISDEELNKLFAMASHEHCHHFGFEEQDCVDLQNLISDFAGNFQYLGNIMLRTYQPEYYLSSGMKYINMFTPLSLNNFDEPIDIVLKIKLSKNFKDLKGPLPYILLSSLENQSKYSQPINAMSTNSMRYDITDCDMQPYENFAFSSSISFKCPIEIKKLQQIFLPLISVKTDFRMGYELPYEIEDVDISVQKNGELIEGTQRSLNLEQIQQMKLDGLSVVYMLDDLSKKYGEDDEK